MTKQNSAPNPEDHVGSGPTEDQRKDQKEQQQQARDNVREDYGSGTGSGTGDATQNDRAAGNQSGLGSRGQARDMTSGRHSGNQ